MDHEYDESQSSHPVPALPGRHHDPVWLHGYNSSNTYLTIAKVDDTEEYNAVGVRKLWSGDYKLHFWPSDVFFGIQAPGAYDRHAGRSKQAYVGAVVDADGLKTIMEQLAAVDVVSVANMELVFSLLNPPKPRGFADEVPDSHPIQGSGESDDGDDAGDDLDKPDDHD